jgi:hypothetical protein
MQTIPDEMPEFPGHGGKRRNSGGSRPGAGRPKGSASSPAPDDVRQRSHYAVLEMHEAKAKKESYQAHIAELEYLERKGKLVNADGVERAAFQFGRILQKNLVDVFPSRISMEIAGMTDPWEIEKFIREKMRIELASVSKLKPEEIEDDAGTE